MMKSINSPKLETVIEDAAMVNPLPGIRALP
jgi:hypothetical protein